MRELGGLMPKIDLFWSAFRSSALHFPAAAMHISNGVRRGFGLFWVPIGGSIVMAKDSAGLSLFPPHILAVPTLSLFP